MINLLRRLRQRLMLTCEDVNRFLAAYLEGALDERTRERFEKHVAGCKPCRRYLAQYRATIDLVKESDDLKEPDDLKESDELPHPPDELTERTLAFLRERY